MTKIVYQTRHGKEPLFFFVGTQSECEDFIYDYLDDTYHELLETALKYNMEWLQALSEVKECTWDYPDYVCYFGHREHYFDDSEAVENMIEYYKSNYALLDFTLSGINLKIGELSE